MKSKFNLMVVLVIVLTSMSSAAFATSFTFNDKDIFNGASFGTMTVTVSSANTLQVRYDFTPGFTASFITGAQTTGFGFSFIPNTLTPTSISNPINGAFSGDRDDLIWIMLNNLNSIPQPSNGDEFNPNVTKDDFFYGATAGNSQNFNPPGIGLNEFDVFYLTFTGGPDFVNSNFNLNQFIDHVGVRIQSLPGNVNDGSIYLVGNTGEQPAPPIVPEPGTILLLGSGLIGFGICLRRRV